WRGRVKFGQCRKSDFRGFFAKTVGVKKPAILRKLGEQFCAHCDDVNCSKLSDQIFKHRSSVRCMADFRGHNKSHAPTRPQQGCGCDQKGRPRGCKSRKHDACPGTKTECLVAYLSFEALIPNEWRVSGRAIEAFPRMSCPLKEFRVVDDRMSSSCRGLASGGQVLLYTD